MANYLIFKKEGEDGADVKGGYFDALLVHASQVSKGSEGGECFFFFISNFILHEK